MEFAHVKLSGDRAGEYVVTEERPDGTLTLVPDTSWKAIKERSGARDASKEEWENFLAEHGSSMLPPDDEG
ncbi:MAG TPA: hypothetical protein VH299_08035 [Solirubrobacterales bacterium]|jgi:hypothetical protein|nr:hypothetical protein [Solirubrobacterales bacterium]